MPKASRGIVEFWTGTTGGKAVLILDGLSLREAPWLLEQAKSRGYKLHRSEVRGAELPGETTPFAKSLGFGQRSALENNGAGAAHKLTGAFTACCNLPWKDCVEMVGSQRVRRLLAPLAGRADCTTCRGRGWGFASWPRKPMRALISDDFWSFVERLATGRRLVITSDHGYAACGEFHDLAGDQATYMKARLQERAVGPGDGDGRCLGAAHRPGPEVGPRPAPVCPGSPQVEERRGLPDVAARRVVVVGIVRAVPRNLEIDGVRLWHRSKGETKPERIARAVAQAVQAGKEWHLPRR